MTPSDRAQTPTHEPLRLMSRNQASIGRAISSPGTSRNGDLPASLWRSSLYVHGYDGAEETCLSSALADNLFCRHEPGNAGVSTRQAKFIGAPSTEAALPTSRARRELIIHRSSM